MKRVIALVLAMLMMLSLAACNPSNPTEPSETAPPKPETPITIKVAVAQTGDGFTVLTDAAAAFNASQSDYIVELYYGGSYTEILTIMQTSTEADRPDIFASSGNDTATYINMPEKMYIPVNDFIKAEGYDDSNIVANLRANYQRNGEWQCWPLGNTNVGQYYNDQVLKAAGVDPATLTSYEAIWDACVKLGNAGYKNFYYLRALTHIDWLNYAMTAQGVDYFDNNNGRGGVPTTSLYGEGACNEAAMSFFTFLRKMLDSNYLVDTSVSSSDARLAFAKQECLIMDGYSSGANSVVTAVKDNGAFEWSYRVSPTVQAGKESKGQSPGGGALFIAKTGDYWRQQGAWEFMKYLLNDQVVVDYAMATGYTPITVSGSKTDKYQDYATNVFTSVMGIIEAQAATGEGVAYAPVPFSSDVNSIYKAICKEMIKDPTYSAEKALADFIAQVNEAVELYRLTNGIT